MYIDCGTPELKVGYGSPNARCSADEINDRGVPVSTNQNLSLDRLTETGAKRCKPSPRAVWTTANVWSARRELDRPKQTQNRVSARHMATVFFLNRGRKIGRSYPPAIAGTIL